MDGCVCVYRYPRLGQWAARQREAYQNEQRLLDGQSMSAAGNRLSPEQIERLNGIGFRWTSRREAQWEKQYNLLLRFASAHGGNANPSTLLDTPEYPKLGKWLDTQRTRYLVGKMPQHRISKMEAAGVIWRPRKVKDRSSWQRHLDLLQKYADNHDGDANPSIKLDTPEYPKLGSWLQTQRMAYHYEKSREAGSVNKKHRNRISKEHIAQLEALGVTWALRKTKSNARWERNFALLKKYAKAHGGDANPSSTLDTPEYPQLGTWVTRQRCGYQQVQKKKNASGGGVGQRADRISATQIERLEAIGFLWSPRRESRESQWLSNFKQLKEYAATHAGATNPPLKDPRYRKLAVWVRTQRSAYRAYRSSLSSDSGAKPKCHNKISADAIEKLESIGFDWNLRPSRKRAAVRNSVKKSQPSETGEARDNAQQWLNMFRLLKEYARTHEGDSNPPRRLDTPEFPKLGPWVCQQRSAYANRRKKHQRAKGSQKQSTAVPNTGITDEQVELLNTIDFVWHGVSDFRWERNFRLLKQYAAAHAGDANPSAFLDTQEYPRLGQWVATQRAAYANEQRRRDGKAPYTGTRISDDRISRLESLGFHWTRKNATERRWGEKFKLLRKYAAAHDGDANPSIKLNSDEYPGLGAWLSRQRQGYANELARKAGQKPGNNRRITPEHAAMLLEIGVRLKASPGNGAKPQPTRKTVKLHTSASAEEQVEQVTQKESGDNKRPGVARKKLRRRVVVDDSSDSDSSSTESADSASGACFSSSAAAGTRPQPLVAPASHQKALLTSSRKRRGSNGKRVVTAPTPRRKRARRGKDAVASEIIDLT